PHQRPTAAGRPTTTSASRSTSERVQPMKPFAIEPDDRAFALARDGAVLESPPSAVSDGSAGALPGADGWHTVRRLPTTTSTQHAASGLRDAQPSARALSLFAAELARRLAAPPPLPKERVWIAAPAGAGRYGLGALLGVARQLAIPFDGFVDAAVVSVAALGGTGPAIVIELGLHHAAATLVERDAGPTCRRRSLLSDHGGLLGLYQAWLDLINTAMVRQTRFDALRDASTEQQLFEALPELSREAMAGGAALAALTERESAGEERAAAPTASHVLFDGRTFALAPEPLVVGRAPAAARAIVLPEGLAGVSRRHCSFLREGLDALLLDHSRFG